MDDSDSTPTDSSSIKPVSSLRSRFENLAQEQQPASPSIQRQPAQKLEPHNNDVRPNAAPARASLDLQRPKSLATNSFLSSNHIHADQPPPIKKRQPTPSKQRPISMISPRPSPPILNVESPHSPPKTAYVAASSATPTKFPSTPPSATPSPVLSVGHSRTPSRVTTPALEARMSAFLQAAHQPDNPSDSDKGEGSTGARQKSQHAAGPPPVNRAGKPKIASKPAALAFDGANPFGTLAPRNGDVRHEEVSPFNTPPSSSEGTPAEQSGPFPPHQSRHRLSMQPSSNHGYFSSWAAQRSPPGQSSDFPPEKPARPISRSYEAKSHVAPPPRLQTSRTFPIEDDAEETAPGLPPRPGRQIQSGRNSPVRQQRIPARRSMDLPRRPPTVAAESESRFMPPPRRASKQSALTQGFGLTVTPTAGTQKPPAPAIPAPRRSVDTRREESHTAPAVQPSIRSADDYDDPPITLQGAAHGGRAPALTDFPNASQSNRRPPQFEFRPWDIATGYDTKLFAVCGEYVCTTGFITRAWSLRTGESCLSLAHGEGIKVTALVFKPTPNVEEEGQRLWLGTSVGEIHEIDIPTQSVIRTKPNAHPRREIVKMYRHGSQLWSLDADGGLYVWSAGREGMPSLDNTPQTLRTCKGHSCSIVVGGQLWLANGKAIHIFQPNATSDTAFQVLQRPLQQESAGDITSVATISSKPDLIYFGHTDGKVSVYNKREYRCVGLVNVSPYKISSMTGAGDYLWTGYNTGRIYVYDTSTTPWRVMKDWLAHDKPVTNIITDRQSLWKLGRLQVVSLGLDNTLRLWDGLLEEDWLESQMQKHDDQFCKFDEISAAVLTWNAGASKPTYLKNDPTDNNFFREYLSSQEPPDIFVFGFQELVDLENKKVTAKSFFKSKKKDPNEQEHVGHQYRAWRDHISRCIEDFMSADQAYALLHTSSMVGLFSCVFVKTSLRSRIKQVNASEVKRGMGGLHGNKGALIIRMILDDSSICLVNCHLAAGQTQTASRNTDAASILESSCLPEAAQAYTPGTFVGGGDGSMILDHELCIWNGDLNYRIDAMPRDAVVRAVKERNLAKLLERDQLLLSRRKNPAFRLQVFQEMPITFAPTYKYNVGTDEYDSSEKKRSPAWCDRVLFRGMGRIKGEDYRRWEVRVSDHRPVSARFKMRIKKADEQKRKKVWQSMEQEFLLYQDKVAAETKLDYLSNVLGLSQKEAASLLR